MRKIIGVLCDLDGTLVDNEWVHVLAWVETAKRYSITLRDDWADDYVGKPDSLFVDDLRVAYPALPEKEALLAERQVIYRRLLVEHQKKIRFPGVSDSLKALEKSGCKLAIGSNSKIENVKAALAAGKLEDHFPVIVSFGMVKNCKPAPDIYIETARRLGLPPESCAVIEDTPLGVASGREAGCIALAVATTTAAGNLKSADRTFQTTADALNWILENNRKADQAHDSTRNEDFSEKCLQNQ